MAGRTKARGRVVFGLVALCVVVAAVAAALLTDTSTLRPDAGPVDEAFPTPTAAPALRAAEAASAQPAPAGVDRALAPLVGDPALGRLTGQVLDDATGAVLWERDPLAPAPPASSAKLLTVTAALATLPADDRLATVLAEGPEAGTLLVVPGGDVTMGEAAPSPLFPGSSTLEQMAQSVRATGFAPRRVVVSPGLYGGPELGPGWDPADIAAGNITPVQPWMTDSGRLDPADEYSPRTDRPMLAAARALAGRLGLPPEAAEIAPAPVAPGRELARIPSATLAERVESALVHSDNVLAESLCREVARAAAPTAPAGFADSTAAVLAALGRQGIDTSGAVLRDCSGMSPEDRVSAALLAHVVRYSARPEASAEQRSLLAALPVGGVSGTLADRFSGPSAGGAGWVRAKTGTLTGTSALAGTVTTTEGRSLSFAFLSSGTSPADARPALDRLAAALHACGCR